MGSLRPRHADDIYDEAYRQQWKQYEVCFDGRYASRGCGAPAVQWDNKYLDADELRKLVASGVTGGPEVFLLSNETKPPKSTQWTVGVRQQLGRTGSDR
jgi:hypothetical protein